MLRVPVYVAVVVALAAASGASGARMYSAAPTAACLKAAGAQIEQGQDVVVTFNYPEIRQQIFWHVGPASEVSNGVFIMFTRNATAAAHLVSRFLRLSVSLGATKVEARRLVGSRANVVWLANFRPLKGLSAKQTALVKRCLK